MADPATALDPMEARILGWLDGSGMESFDRVLPELHALQFGRNAPYRAFCQSLGVGEHVAHWREVPPLPQEAFKHADLRTFPPAQTIRTFHTSGTTGEGYGRHHFRTLAIYEAAVLAGWHHAELPGEPYLVLAPHPDEAPHSSLSHMFAALAPRENFIAWGGNIDLLRLRDLSAPVCLLGTATASCGCLKLSARRASISLRIIGHGNRRATRAADVRSPGPSFTPCSRTNLASPETRSSMNTDDGVELPFYAKDLKGRTTAHRGRGP